MTRALEKLRTRLLKHGVTLTTTVIASAVASNAIQAAPVGLATTISAAGIAGATATTALIMTTLQKLAVTAALTVSVGVGIYEAKEATKARSEVQALQQQQAPLIEQAGQIKAEREKLASRLSSLADEMEKRKGNLTELLKLRGEVTLLGNQLREADKLGQQFAQITNGPTVVKLDPVGNIILELNPITNEFARSVGYGLASSHREYVFKKLNLLKQRIQLSESQEQSAQDLLNQYVENLYKPRTASSPGELAAAMNPSRQLEAKIKQLLSPEQKIAYEDMAQGLNLAAARYQASIELLDMQKIIPLSIAQQQRAFEVLVPLHKTDFPELFNPVHNKPLAYEDELSALKDILNEDELKIYGDYRQSLMFTNQFKRP